MVSEGGGEGGSAAHRFLEMDGLLEQMHHMLRLLLRVVIRDKDLVDELLVRHARLLSVEVLE